MQLIFFLFCSINLWRFYKFFAFKSLKVPMNHSLQRCEEATVQPRDGSSNILKIVKCQPVCKKTHFTPTWTHMNLTLDLWLTPYSLNGCCMYKSMYAASRGRGCWLTHYSRTLGHLHLWRCINIPRLCFPHWNWAPDILICFSNLPAKAPDV